MDRDGSQRSRDDERSIARQLGAEQVAQLFEVVRLTVGSSLLGAISLAFILVRYSSLDRGVGFVWSLCIALCALAHVTLREAYVRSPDHDHHWRRWGNLFAVVSLAEGVGWGWGSVVLAGRGGLDAELLTLLVLVVMASGSIQPFGPYLPAFLGFFLPATIPYAVFSLTTTTKMEQATGVLMVLFVFAMGAIGVKSNRRFRQLIVLRLEMARLATELRAQKDIAEAANRAKSSFLAAASHDLRQPVHALGLFVGALRMIEMPAEAARLVEQIDLSSQAMDSLFAALLDISRLDAGTVDVHKMVFAIDDVLARICVEHAAEAATNSIGLKHRPCGGFVFCDPLLVERVLRNLISNAVRYTRSGRVLVGCRRRRGTIVVQIWDTGPGIPIDQQDRIFQEYYQIGNTERDRTKGLGLGLAIVRRLTRLLEVPLRLRSLPGRGTCFELELPRAPAPAMATPMALGDDCRLQPEGRLIVVIDDEAPIRAAMFSVLSGWGHDVVIAASGEEAIRLLSHRPRRPDIIVCDLRLREGEVGTAVIEMLRTEFNEAIPAILVTGDTAPDRLAEAKTSGLLLLHKPVSNGRLRAAIANVIAHAEPRSGTA